MKIILYCIGLLHMKIQVKIYDLVRKRPVISKLAGKKTSLFLTYFFDVDTCFSLKFFELEVHNF